jgi:hypothetical protein
MNIILYCFILTCCECQRQSLHQRGAGYDDDRTSRGCGDDSDDNSVIHSSP